MILQLGYLRLILSDLFGGTSIIKTLLLFKSEQYLPINDLNDLRMNRLNKLINIAKKSVPFYHSASSYQSFGVIDKPIVRANYTNLISSDHTQKLYPKATGGSTGMPLNYLATSESRSAMWAGIIMSWQVAGYTLGDKVAFIAGTSIAKSNFKHAVFYKLLNIDVYSVYQLSNANIELYLQRIKKSKVAIIYGYASAIGHIANYLLEHKTMDFPHLKGIVCTAEVLTDNVRNAIQKAFFVSVYNQYGCNEAGISAFECKHHQMHLISSRCFYELDMEGNLISTDLFNQGFIMMRYKTGDKIALDESHQCKCNSSFPIIKHVIGRSCDIITDYMGNKLHSCFFNILFKEDQRITQFQIMYNQTDLKIYLNTNQQFAVYSHYENYITEIKKHLQFDKYTIIFNAPFLKTDNAKHRFVIKEN